MNQFANHQLRPWQGAALEEYLKQAKRDFLAVVTPGAGKTRWAMVTALQSEIPRIVVVCPTIHVKRQWAAEADLYGFRLGDLSDLQDGDSSITTTYQQVTQNAELFAELMAEMPTMTIFDEIHHASDKNSWGVEIRKAFENAEARICLTGTAFRSDSDMIPFVTYEDGLCRPDFVYGYGQAVADYPPIVRPLEWRLFDGEIGWQRLGEEEQLFSFADRLKKRDRSARLSACLDPAGGFMRSMLVAAEDQLRAWPGDGGLVIARSCDHADAIARVLAEATGEDPLVVHTKTDSPGRKLAAFREGQGRWLVSVKMVSEGVDIPRLRVLVYATNTNTELFFRQAMGRIVRGNDGPGICFIPSHDKFLAIMQDMHNERLHEIQEKASCSGAGGSSGPSTVEAIYSVGWEDRVLRVAERPEIESSLLNRKACMRLEWQRNYDSEYKRIKYEEDPGFRDAVKRRAKEWRELQPKKGRRRGKISAEEKRLRRQEKLKDPEIAARALQLTRELNRRNSTKRMLESIDCSEAARAKFVIEYPRIEACFRAKKPRVDTDGCGGVILSRGGCSKGKTPELIAIFLHSGEMELKI